MPLSPGHLLRLVAIAMLATPALARDDDYNPTGPRGGSGASPIRRFWRR